MNPEQILSEFFAAWGRGDTDAIVEGVAWRPPVRPTRTGPPEEARVTKPRRRLPVAL